MFLCFFNVFVNLRQRRGIGTSSSAALTIFKQLARRIRIQSEIRLRFGCLQLWTFILRENDAEGLKTKSLFVVFQLIQSFENGSLRNNSDALPVKGSSTVAAIKAFTKARRSSSVAKSKYRVLEPMRVRQSASMKW